MHLTPPTDRTADFGPVTPNGPVSELVIVDREGLERRVVLETSKHIEAPNWTVDGTSLVFNGDGRLYRFLLDREQEPVEIESAPVHNFNNDHCLSPNGKTVYASADDGHIYEVSLTGGTPSQITSSKPSAIGFRHYLHGVSPDGTLLVYVGLEKTVSGKTITNLYTVPAIGGMDIRLTDVSYPVDGPEFSPDGKWIYFNSEQAARRPGDAQIFRMKADGSSAEQLTNDDRVNWFPHVSPDGTSVAFISFPEGTQGHPSDKDVLLRIMSPDGSRIRELDRFNGGQGTLNVSSWSPDSRYLAYVRYRQPQSE